MTARALDGAARAVLDTARERLGRRTVQDSSDAIRGGNNLYLWQWAFLERQAGRSAAVVRSATMPDWLAEFPLLGELTIDRADLRFLDRRRFATRFVFDLDFDRRQCALFCRALVASSPEFRRRIAAAEEQVGPGTVVVNVRRGDYYSVPEFSRRFALDIPHHVTEALTMLRAEGRDTTDVIVVSDDIDWCRRELAEVLGPFRTLQGRSSMFDDLAALATSRTLVLANSTFSYWGSYLAASRDIAHRAIAPSHHEILPDGERVAPMLDPAWPRTGFRPLPR